MSAARWEAVASTLGLSALAICGSAMLCQLAGNGVKASAAGASGTVPARQPTARPVPPGCTENPPAPDSVASAAGALRFACRGYVWQSVRIVAGGVMPGVYFHPTEPGLMYIRADVGGAYRWSAATSLWTPLTDWLGGTSADWSLMGIESIAVDPADARRVYLAAGMYIDSGSPIDAAILVSANRGNTFQRVDLPFKMGGNDLLHGQQTGERLAVNPFQPNELYLGTHENGLWVSEDYGSTWSRMASFPVTSSPDLAGVLFVRFDPRHAGTVYAGAYTGGIYRSTDSGATWRQVPGQPTTLPNGETLRPMRCSLGPDGLLYVTYANSAGMLAISNGAVYRFDTGTGVWTDITPPDRPSALWYGYCAVSADAQRNATVVVGTWNRWYPGDDFFRSTDGGITWRSLKQSAVIDTSLSPYLDFQPPLFGWWNASFEIDPFDSNHAIYDAANSVLATNDLTNLDSGQPTHWYVGANGIEETVSHQVVSPPSGAHLLSAIADQGGFRHDDFNVSPLPFQNPYMIEVASLDFAGSNPALMARVGLLDYVGHIAGAWSADGGASWTQFAATPPGSGLGPTADGYVASVAVSADGATVIWAEGDTVPAYSRDRSATFHSSAGAPVGLLVVSDRVNPGKFYGYDPASGAVFVSTDGGVSFVAGATGLPQDYGSAGWTAEANLKAVAGHEGDVWLPTSTGLYHSTDSGASFERLASIDSAPLVGFGMAAPGASYPAVYAVGTVAGVYGIFRSDDMGATWIRINDDRHQYGMLGDVSGDPRIYGRVYLATQGRGIVYGDPLFRPRLPEK